MHVSYETLWTSIMRKELVGATQVLDYGVALIHIFSVINSKKLCLYVHCLLKRYLLYRLIPIFS